MQPASVYCLDDNYPWGLCVEELYAMEVIALLSNTAFIKLYTP